MIEPQVAKIANAVASDPVIVEKAFSEMGTRTLSFLKTGKSFAIVWRRGGIRTTSVPNCFSVMVIHPLGLRLTRLAVHTGLYGPPLAGFAVSGLLYTPK